MKRESHAKPLAAAVALALVCSTSHAAQGYMQVSAGETMWRGTTPIGDFEFVLPANWFKGFEGEFGVTLLDQAKYHGMTTPANSILRAGVGDEIGHFAFGLGVANIINPAPFNGSHQNFALTAAYRFDCGLSMQYMHFSNANEAQPNIGRDMLELGWRF